MEKREPPTISKEDVINLYQELLVLIRSDEFGEYLKEELDQSYPEYLQVLEKRVEDMERTDHGIVIAGETSSGKSTLINKILKKNVFQGRTNESTSTICKLRNSQKITIKVEHNNDEVEEIDIPEDICMETPEGIENLRELLMRYTDLTMCTESKEYHCVDIGLPIPFLKGNVILVDTPGIGGSGDVTQKVMDYLSSALSFVFVVNAASAGGMQGDRLPVILKSLGSLQVKKEMPCFNPEDVIFLTNKWDTIIDACDESATQREIKKTWETLKRQIKNKWAAVQEENIFRLNLKDVLATKPNESTQQFEAFLKKLEVMIRNAEKLRVVKHVSFLQGILGNIKNMIEERCAWKQLDEKKKNAKTKEKKETLMITKLKCKEFEEKVRKMTKNLETQTAREAYDYMITEEGKDEVLNPDGCIPILQVKFWSPTSFAEEVRSRVLLHVSKVMKSDKFVQRFQEIRDMTIQFYIETCRNLDKEFENDTENLGQSPNTSTENQPESEIHHALFAVPILLAGVLSLPISFVLAGLYLFFTFSISETKKKIIDSSYKEYTPLVRDKIKEESCSLLREIIDKVMLDLFPRRIAAYEERARQLQSSYDTICAEHETLLNLAEKVNTMKDTVNTMNQHLNVKRMIALEN